MMKRLLSVLVAISMAVTLLPLQIFAADAEWANPFTDVQSSDWFYDSVAFVNQNNLFSGATENTFEPDGLLTRGMFVTVLGRMAKIETQNYIGKSDFADVDTKAYYAPYVTWASKKKIASGTGIGIFSPNEKIDRQQMAAFFVRYFDAMQIHPEGKNPVNTEPADFSETQDWAKESVLKLWKLGLINGDGNYYKPNATATRAEAATVFMRVAQAISVPNLAEIGASAIGQVFGNGNFGSGGGSSGGSGGVTGIAYTVSFETNGGDLLRSIEYQKDSKLGVLPTPLKEGSVFTAWYYDKELTKAVAAKDTVSKNIKLYAKYLSEAEAEHTQTPRSSVAMDVSADFEIAIHSAVVMRAEDVLAGITAKNLNSPEDMDIIAVDGNGTSFTVRAKNGYEKGASYKITLNNDNLSFDGQQETVRDYDFTTKADEVLNTKLSESITYLPASDLDNIVNNGQSVQTLSMALYNADASGNITPSDLTTGSFSYNGSTDLKVGDTVAVYSGLRPDQRDLYSTDEENGDLAYIEITAVNGNSYTYKNADPENVIFEPDVLPISSSADLDGDTENNAVTVDNSTIDYSEDIYINLDLDSQTTADTGDFIAFYRGTFASADTALDAYAQITEVHSNTDDTTTIEYVIVSWEQVQAAMDIYASEQVDGDAMLEEVNRGELEEQIELQAVESGFANEAGMYLASVALATDNFSNLDDSMALLDYSATAEDGTAIISDELQLMGASEVDVRKDKIKAKISTNLPHFDGYSGVSLILEVGVTITVTDEDGNKAIVTLTGTFDQEVRLDLGVSSKAVWKVWGIFPYISEYKVTANVDLFDYTGIDIQAGMVTQKGDGSIDREIMDISAQMKQLLNGTKLDGEGYTVSESLAKRYQQLLSSDSDCAVSLIEKNIFEKEFRVPPALPIIAVQIGVDFVVTADSVVSLGFDYYYKNAKRYVYTINVFAGKVYNDVIDIAEETYELNFNVMGKVNLRAGIKAEFQVGLLSTKVASIGFTAEAGAYIKLFGYFSYSLKYTASSGRKENCAGAMRVEVGIYLDVNFVAQAIGGKYSTKLTLYEHEWPLWTAGNQFSILDFTTEPEDLPEIKLKQYIRNAYLPDSVFDMSRQNLYNGNIGNAYYDDAKYFDIEITNPAFTYDAGTNRITVTPSAEDKRLEGEMIITWINFPMAHTSEPIQRRINLYWDNLRDGYVIAPYTNGGSYVPMIMGSYESAVSQPANPTKVGYVFANWYKEADFQTTYVFPQTMPNTDAEIYAKWERATNTPYTVEHYKQLLGSSLYEIADTDALIGTTDTTVTPALKYYSGYSAPEEKSINIKPDGSAVLRYYYNPQIHTVTFEPGEVGGEADVYSLKYGAEITAPVFAAKGYIFEGWDGEVQQTMGTENLVYTARWTKDNGTEYRVEYYTQLANGKYALKYFENRQAVTGQTIDVSTLRKDAQYCSAGAIHFAGVTVNGLACEGASISGDGKTIIKVNYARDEHTATFHPENGGEPITITGRWQDAVTVPTVARIGYTFDGWNTEVDAQFGLTDVSYTALWTPNTDTAYKAEYYQQNANNDDYTLAATETLAGTTAEIATAPEKTYQNFHIQPNAEGFQQSGEIAADGSLVLKIYYDRNTYTVTYFNENEQYGDVQTMRHGQTVVTPTGLTQSGFNFGGWYWGENSFSGIMPAENVDLHAKWLVDTEYPYTVNYYKEGIRHGENELVRTEVLHGIYGEEIEVRPQDHYSGFSDAVNQTVTLHENLVIDFVYTRNSYRLYWDFGGGTPTASDYTTGGDYRVQFDEPIIAPILFMEGHSYTWDKTIAEKMPANELSYRANWTANSYQITFMKDENTLISSEQMEFGTPLSAPENIENKQFYTFTGWSEAVPNTVPAENKTYIAQWEPIRYNIYYYNMDGATFHPDTRMYYTAEDEGRDILFYDPSKPGYAFDGWYLDGDYHQRAESFRVTSFMGDYASRIFLAKWSANHYFITYDHGLSSGFEMNTQEFVYDTEENLDANTYSNPGFKFLGWSRSPDSTEPEFTDGQLIRNLAAEGNLTLYAVWEAITYTITYSNVGDGAISHSNPTSYTVTSEDVILKAPDGIKSGYQFLGWFDVNDATTPITTIPKTAMREFNLKAKYAHGGVFNLAYKSTDGSTSTYGVTRSIPGGNVIVTSDPQYLYYRTINGTAIGGTAAAINFKHVGGEDAFLLFNPSDGSGTEKTFTVTGENANATYNKDGSVSYPATAFVRSGANRNYSVELYKIVNLVGNCTGSLGTKSVTRTLSPDSTHQITPEIYTVWSEEPVGNTADYPNGIKVTDDTWYNVKYQVNPWSVWNELSYKPYLEGTIDTIIWRISLALQEWDNGNQIIRFWASNSDDPDNETWDIWQFGINGLGNYQWWHKCIVPTNPDGGTTGFKSGDESVTGGVDNFRHTTQGFTYDPQYSGLLIPIEFDQITIGFAAVGDGENDYYFKKVVQNGRPLDKTAPAQIGIAPMAFGKYKKGDTVTISVIYNEIINACNNVTAANTTLAGMELRNFSFCGGSGTNVLTFKAIVNNDCEITPNSNNTIIDTKLSVSGVLKDLADNS